MAEKKAAGKEVKEAKDAEPAADGAGKKKKLILIAAGGVLVLVLCIVLGIVLLGGNSEDEDATAEEVHAPPALYVALGQRITVTLPGAGKPHHLQVSISALTRDQAVVDELNFNAPLLSDRLSSLLARQEFERLRTEEGKLALREEVLKTVQGIVAEALEQGHPSAAKGDDEEEAGESPKGERKTGKEAQGREPHAPGVEQIFFTEFVLQ